MENGMDQTAIRFGAACWVVLLGVGGAHATAGDKKPISPAAAQFFESKVRPVLVEHCLRCHGDIKKPKGELRLDSLAAALEGGERGPAVVPGQPDKSLLVKAIGYQDKHLKMPPTQKLSREQIAD